MKNDNMSIFPKECLLTEHISSLLAGEFLNQLNKEGFTTDDLLHDISGARVSAMKITCAKCNVINCSNNNTISSTSFSILMNGQWAERRNRGNEILEQLLPREKRRELEDDGVKIVVSQMPSRKNPKLIFSFEKDDKKYYLYCHLGDRKLLTNDGDEPLKSFVQISEKIKEIMKQF